MRLYTDHPTGIREAIGLMPGDLANDTPILAALECFAEAVIEHATAPDRIADATVAARATHVDAVLATFEAFCATRMAEAFCIGITHSPSE